MISLKEHSPELEKEWDFDKNKKTPSEVSYGSGTKYWWICKNGHEWLQSPNVRTRGNGCPYCSGQYVIKGETDLETTHPEVLNYWDYEKNSIKPSEVKSGSHTKAWWKCKNNHTWQAPIYRITIEKRGCPYCTNQKVLEGYNDLASKYPKLLEEWDYEKNKVNPNKVLYGSTKKVWWKCQKCGNIWQTSIVHRTGIHKTSCPECAKQKYRQTQLKNQIMKEGSFGDNYPELLKEWDYNKNTISPYSIVSKSSKKVHWKCRKGHEWEAMVVSRTRDNGTGCPTCSGKKVLVGYNDLKSQQPILMKEWDYERNDDIGLSPEKITSHSEKKAYWICPSCGTSYKAAICHRVNGTSCPECAKEMKTSFGEQTIYYYLSKVLKTENRWNYIGTEVDVFCPELNLGIEYDGELYHTGEKSNLREKKKYLHLKELGIKLIRVKENTKKNKVENHADLTIEIRRQQYDKELEKVIYKILEYIKNGWNLDFDLDINIKRDRQSIYSQYVKQKRENSVAKLYPNLIKDWDYEKNKISPYNLTPSSSKRVWWKCEKGHSYESMLSNHIKHKSQCPYCRNLKVLKGYNDLVTTNPKLAEEWNYEKNVLKPIEVVEGSNKKVWWKCPKCDYEWQSKIQDRSRRNSSCPKCKNK